MKPALSQFALAAIALSALDATAQSFPGRSLRVIVPYTAGGSSDYVGRVVAESLGKSLGQQAVVENRPGGNTIIGSEVVARAQGDGHVLLVMGSTTLAAGPSLYKKLPYDSLRDFTPVSNVANSALVLIVHPSLPAKNPRELVALAKARPGTINFASAGIGNTLHFAAELFKSRAGIDIRHVPYKGASQALVDLVGGQVPMMFDLIITAKPHVDSGRLRALATTYKTRAATLPDVPTLHESGFSDFQFGSSIGVFGSGGLPAPVLTRLHAEVVAFVQRTDTRAEFTRRGMDAIASPTPAAYAQAFRDEVQLLARIVKEAGIQPE